MHENIEIEARFLGIDKSKIIEKLISLGASDLGEDVLEEVIFYDMSEDESIRKRKLVRLRKTKNKIELTFKHNKDDTIHGTTEINVNVDDMKKTTEFLEAIGLVAFRFQQKKRHTFKIGDVTIDIDTWPVIPPYLEIEGCTEESVRKMADILGLNWDDALFENAGATLRKHYNLEIINFRNFTFDKIG